MSSCTPSLDVSSLPFYEGWEVGQRTQDFSSDYLRPGTPTLFRRDEVFETEIRIEVLLALRENGDPSIPSWTQGARVFEESDSIPYLVPSPLRALYDLISNGEARRLVMTLRSFIPASPRKAFFVSALVDSSLTSLQYQTGDSYTDTRFNGYIREAVSLWDFMTSFDPVFLPLEGGGGYLLRNLDPVSDSLPGCPDEYIAIVPTDDLTLSDSYFMPPAYAHKPIPTGLDLSGGVLSSGTGASAGFFNLGLSLV
jgi:hypothetical protein